MRPKPHTALGLRANATGDEINTERGHRRLRSDYGRFAIESFGPQPPRRARITPRRPRNFELLTMKLTEVVDT